MYIRQNMLIIVPWSCKSTLQSINPPDWRCPPVNLLQGVTLQKTVTRHINGIRTGRKPCSVGWEKLPRKLFQQSDLSISMQGTNIDLRPNLLSVQSFDFPLGEADKQRRDCVTPEKSSLEHENIKRFLADRSLFHSDATKHETSYALWLGPGFGHHLQTDSSKELEWSPSQRKPVIWGFRKSEVCVENDDVSRHRLLESNHVTQSS